MPSWSGVGGLRTRLLGRMTLSAERGGGPPSAPPRPIGNSPAPRPWRPRPQTLKTEPASREPTPQPEPWGGETRTRLPQHLKTSGRRTPPASGPGSTEAAARPARLPPPPPPPGECLPGWGAAGGNRGRAVHTRADPPDLRRAHTHSGRTRGPQSCTITWANSGTHGGRAPCAPSPPPLSGSPRAPTAPRPGCAHARVRGSPARGAASRQNKHPLPPPTAGPSGMTSFMKQTPLRGWPSHSLGLLLPPGVTLVLGMNTPNPCPPVQIDGLGSVLRAPVTQGRARGPQACSP